MNSREFDDIIKQSAQQREADVPGDIWENIARKKKRRRGPFFWFIFMLLFLAGTFVVWNINNNTPAKFSNVKNELKENKNPNYKNNDYRKNSTENITTDSLTDIAVNDHSINTPGSVVTDRSLNNGKEIRVKTNINTKAVSKNLPQPGSTKGKNILHKKSNRSYTVSIISVDPTEEKIYPTAHNKRKSKGRTRTNISNGETESTINSIASDAVKTDNANEITGSLKIDSADSSTTKKFIPVISDSPSIKKEITNTVSQKEKRKKKKKSLMIEVGLTVVFPMQQYEHPEYVKRTISNTDMLSEFKSDNIKTAIETGAGLTINLVKPLNKKWSMGGGIQYLRLTERLHFEGIETVTNYTIVKRLVTDPNGSYLKNDTVSSTTRNNTTINGRNIYNIFSIPLFVRYQFLSGKKLSCAFTTGIYIDLLRYQNKLPGKFENVYASGKQFNNSKNEIGLDLFAGIHLSGILRKKYNWFAEPGFRYNLFTSKTGNLSFNKMIHKPGINFGIIYPLGK